MKRKKIVSKTGKTKESAFIYYRYNLMFLMKTLSENAFKIVSPTITDIGM
jgi:hypothetical protein